MYERIYADLLAKIQNGDYQPGDRLPSEKESAELYGVSRITAKKAMDMLAKEKRSVESREEVLLCAVRLLLWR